MFWPFQICNVGHYITKEYICRIITFDVENKWKKKDQEESLILAPGRFSARDVFLTMAIAPRSRGGGVTLRSSRVLVFCSKCGKPHRQADIFSANCRIRQSILLLELKITTEQKTYSLDWGH